MSDAPPPSPPDPSPLPADYGERIRAGRFVEQLHALTPTPRVTQVLLAANILVYLAVGFAGVNWIQASGPSLIDWGANYGPRTTHGEWWRLLTSMFLHGGIVHIAANMWALYNVGNFYEKLVGHAGLAVMYFATGLIASTASVWWHPDMPSVGASGAVFGLFGALLGYLIRERHSVPRLVLRPLMRSVLLIIAINVFIGFSIPYIDNAAHLGGLGTGLLLGLVLARPITPAGGRQRRSAALSTAALGAALVLGLTALVPRVADLDALFHQVATADQATQTRYAEVTNARTQGGLSDADYVNAIETEILPVWRELEKVLAGTTEVPPRLQEEVDLLRDYVAARHDFYELRAQGIRNQDDAALRQATARSRDASLLLDRLNPPP